MMAEQVVIHRQIGDEECRIPVGAIDPAEIECLADLDAAIAAWEEARREYGEHIHVADLEACEW